MAPPDLAENAGRGEKAWERKENQPIIRFCLDNGDWLGMPLFQQVQVRYIKQHSAILFMFQRANIVVVGPEALSLHSAYCAHWAQDIKANKKEIISIRTVAAADVGALFQP